MYIWQKKNVLENQMFAVYDQWSKGYFSLNAQIEIQVLNGVYYVHWSSCFNFLAWSVNF